MTDLLHRKMAEAELARSNRALHMLSDSNQTLIRAGDESSLLREICRIAVEVGGYRMAWVGFAEHDASRTVRPVATAGFDEGYLATAGITWGEGTDGGGPAATAIATGEPCIVRDIALDPIFKARGEAAQERGYHSAIALPLVAGGVPIGVFKIYSSEVDAFDAAEVSILSELAGDVAYGVTALRTRAERDRVAEALRDANLRLERAQSIAHLGHWDRDFDAGRITSSREASRILGIEHTDAGLSLGEWQALWMQLVHPDDRERVGRAMAAAIGGEASYDLDYRIVRPDGEERIVHSFAEVVRDESGRPRRMMGTLHDITERKRGENALRSAEQTLSTLMDLIPDLLARFDRNGRVTYASPSVGRLLNVAPETLLGRSPLEIGGVADEGMKKALGEGEMSIGRVVATGKRERYFVDVDTPVGSLPFEIRTIPEMSESGDVVSVLGIVTDLRERKAAERQRYLLDYALSAIGEAIYLMEGDSPRFVYVNKSAASMLGYTQEELVSGMGVLDIDPEMTPERWEGVIENIKRQGRILLESTHRRKDGSTFPIEVTGNYFDFEGRNYDMAVVRDISQRREAESTLRDREQRFRQVTENIDEVFWLTSADKAELVYVSPAFERVYGRSCDSLFANPQSWLEIVHPDDRNQVLSAIPLQVTGQYDLEYRIRRSGGMVAWIHERAFPIHDPEGRVYRIAGVAEDVTHRRELESQLRQAQKMEAIGLLAGGIAHDFNNMLAIIQMESSLLLEEVSGADALTKGLNDIQAAAERASNLTRQLLTFSRRQVIMAVDLDLSDTLGDLTKLLRRVLGEDISLETRFAPSLPLVHADPGMMEQVLMNLAINARDAMPDGGQLSVTLDARTIAERPASDGPGATSARYVCLSVSDTGCGIPEADLPRIFEPFFTTKEVGKGTGLGLATVFGIVQQHGGWVEVESTVGRGTTFRVLLPVLESSTPSARAGVRPSRAVVGGHETVLLVEDESRVRAVTRAVLERHGYRVLEADCAAAALEVWDAESTRIDLLLTDLVMPGGMNGRQLADELRRRAPRLAVVYATGYSADAVAGMIDLRCTVLHKPCAAADLAAAVRRCLDEPSEPEPDPTNVR